MNKYVLLLLGAFFAGLTLWFVMHKQKQLSSHQPIDWIVVIPGITGDLAKRKLIPALYNVSKSGLPVHIIGTGRRAADIQSLLKDWEKYIGDKSAESWKQFSERIEYQKLDPQVKADFDALAKRIAAIENNKASKRVLYLSLPAEVFCTMTRNCVESGIIIPHAEHTILYEKPFGWDLASAREIQVCLSSLLPEKQIYRVDHYVAKGLTQSLPIISSNPVFSPIWNAQSISSVQVLFHEKIDIEGRGSFYDRYGAIKDVIQNHVLQLLAFFAVDLKAAKTKEQIVQQKVNFLRSLKVRSVKRGQYEGYTTEKDVDPKSKAETYAAIVLESSLPKWKGINFSLEAGKALSEKNTSLRIAFSKNKEMNLLAFNFAPKESLVLGLRGFEDQQLELKTEKMTYLEAYEALFMDVFKGTLQFAVTFPEIEAQWELTERIIALSSSLETYPKGTRPEFTNG